MGRTVRGQIVIGGLGNCEPTSWSLELTGSGFFLLAMISFSLFPVFRSIKDRPQLQEKLVTGLLTPLAIADVRPWFHAFEE